MILGVLSFYGYKKYQVYESKSNLYISDDLSYPARIENKNYQLYKDGDWMDVTIKGVNLGVAKPGSFPGDMAIDRTTYLRWFQLISDMNANIIRVYTLQNTDFYEALYEFNLNNDNPLFVIHGVWVNEEAIATYNDAFHNSIYDGFVQEAIHIIDAIHGNANIEPMKGHASGEYTKDVSHYVIGWILGIEYEAILVNTTNENNPNKTAFEGNYLYTENANPFEVFLAETGDKIISYETEKYGMQRPTAFSNWLTTDPLDHPNEPTPETEDSAVIDVEHIKWKDSFEPGMFASYHIYPYYPDFLNYDTKYVIGDDEINTYRAYLEELTSYHTLPVLVSEVGLPSSRGIAHRSIYSGYNQGFLTEQQQGDYVANMIDDIIEMNCLGFIVFSWQDEWFKRSWNTMDLENPDGRPQWMNVQTCEQNFGLLAFESGEEDNILYVDGQYEDWSEEDILVTNNNYTLSVQEDYSYLYLLVDTKEFNFYKDTIYIPIDTIKNQGNSKYQSFSFDKECDFIIKIKGPEESQVLVDPYYDVFYYQYGVLNQMVEEKDNYNVKNSGYFNTIRLALNKPQYLPETKIALDFETVDTGKLTYGIANPTLEEFNSLADFYYKDGKIELRIPWGLLSFSNPATCEIINDLYDNNKEIDFTTIDRVSFGLAIEDNSKVVFSDYQMRGWDQLIYHERTKLSYYILQQKYAHIK